MKALIKKEIRLLFPAWIAAMLLAVAPVWLIEYFLPYQDASVAPFLILPGLLLLGISAFGREFSTNTFSLLLSQPVIRNRAWRLKILMLAFAFVLVLAAVTISWSLFIQQHPQYSSHFLDAFPGLWLWTAALFTGGLWTTLLLRQEIGAIWVTLLVPAAILAGVGILAEHLNWSEKIEDRIADLAIFIYSTVGFLFARRLFLHAQDTQWTGGDFILWSRRRNELAGHLGSRPIRNRFVTLLWKEIQLQDTNLFIAAIILSVNLATIGLRPFISNGNLKSALEFVWALWLLMPLLIGCSAVAEERRLGVAEAQLCQPVSRRAALCIKFLVAFVLSVILGAALPSLIEWTCDFGITDWLNFWIFIAAPAIFFISFYASTLSRSTVHAIGVAVAVSVAGSFGFLICAAAAFHSNLGLSGSHYVDYQDVCRVYLMRNLCFLIFPLVLVYLMFWNFKWLQTGWRLFRRNAATVAITFAILVGLTNLIYYRTWELLFPLEAPRGPAHLTPQSEVNIPSYQSYGHPTLTALLPDGRLWQQGLDFQDEANPPYLFEYGPELETHRFIDSQWTTLSANAFHIVGIQRNGSLWRIPLVGSKIPMAQIGSDTNWWKVAGIRDAFLLLKKDGTLWIWGTNQTPEIDARIKLDMETPPQRIGTGNDWTNVSSFAYTALAQKDDGSYWSLRYSLSTLSALSFRLVQETNPDTQWISYCYWYNNDLIEVKSNGQLWSYSQIDTNWLKSLSYDDGSWTEGAIRHYTKKVQLGSDSDWKAISFGPLYSLILLRNDGTLWKWTGPPENSFRPVRLGHYSDWVSLDPELGIAVAVDGSLWSWGSPSDHRWLAPPRKPLYGKHFRGRRIRQSARNKNRYPVKTLIKKEIRLLLPAWIAAMLLAVAPGWLIECCLPDRGAAIEFPPPFFVLPGLFLLGISAFGREFRANTFSLLLSQPVVRNRAWQLKTLTLALAFALVLAAGTISWSFFIQLHPAYSPHFFDAFPGVLLWTAAIFTGGLWTTLLLRQEVGALWVTLVVPAAILAGVGVLSDTLNFSEHLEYRIGDVAILIYSAAGFLFARQMFLHAQDVQWIGGTFFFWRRKASESSGFFISDWLRNRFLVLIWKEIQLHEANLFIAAILFVINLAVVPLVPHISNANLKMALQFTWALWLLMPLLIGSAAVAEERRLGVAEFELCQPVSRQAAFSIKFLVALVLSVILGALMPTLIERSRNFGITNWIPFWIFIPVPVIFFISFYASTLSRSAIHAIGMAVADSLIGWCGFLAFAMLEFHVEFGTFGTSIQHYNYYDYLDVCRLYLLIGLCLLIFPLVLARLMFWNYKCLYQGWRLIRINVAAILISFTAIFILTNAIFYRSWDLFTPVETPHGPARLAAETPVRLLTSPTGMFALLPDGRLWQQRIESRESDFGSMETFRWYPVFDSARFIGSNWVDVSPGYLYILGIQRNGSLWSMPEIGNKIRKAQIGSETNWLKVAMDGNGFLLLRKDGTLWLWGTNRADNVTNEFARVSRKIELDLATPPRRIDPCTNWTDLIPFEYNRALAKKSDGTFWSWRNLTFNDGSSGSYLVMETNLDNQWISYAYNGSFSAEVKTNGQLWLFDEIDTNWNYHGPNGGYWNWIGVPHYTKRIQLGPDSDWKAVTIGMNSLILLRNDGTLWKWKLFQKKPFHPVQLGNQSDWTASPQALAGWWGTALAADGSLWSWDEPSDTFWLAPSRKPVYMGNIFQGRETGQPVKLTHEYP